MKRQQYKQVASATMLAVLGVSSLGATSVFATSPNYGITYSTTGAQILGQENNVIEKPTLIEKLEPLIQANNVKIEVSGGWLEGYINDGIYGCRKIHYFTVNDQEDIENSNYSVNISSGQYHASVQIVGASVESHNDEVSESYRFDGTAAIGVADDVAGIYGGWQIYDSKTIDGECSGETQGISRVQRGNAHLFVETKIKTYRGNQKTPLKSKELYFGLTDIDAAQSYKILNPENIFSKDNMFAADVTNLQPSSGTLRNYYVPYENNTGGYIFSGYNVNEEPFNTENISNIYVNLTEETQEEGLDIVFGFANNAASGIEYYAQQYDVSYKSAGNGSVGLTSEPVIAGENPSGSETTPDTGYAFSHWVSNVPVRLKSDPDTEIPAGTLLTDEEVKQVIVDQDIEFTAYFDNQYTVIYDSDENGSIKGITRESVKKNDNPNGSEQASNDGYTLSHWIADVDVTLEDGTKIKAGNPITTDQITQVVVDKNIKFTAIHVTKVATPDTGVVSKGVDAAQIATISLFSIAGLGLAIKMLPRVLRKKVNFNK